MSTKHEDGLRAAIGELEAAESELSTIRLKRESAARTLADAETEWTRLAHAAALDSAKARGALPSAAKARDAARTENELLASALRNAEQIVETRRAAVEALHWPAALARVAERGAKSVAPLAKFRAAMQEALTALLAYREATTSIAQSEEYRSLDESTRRLIRERLFDLQLPLHMVPRELYELISGPMTAFPPLALDEFAADYWRRMARQADAALEHAGEREAATAA
ncbi:MAG: hypothetical protein ACHQRJ_03745 [Alphaproteobacteria bacterium]